LHKSIVLFSRVNSRVHGWRKSGLFQQPPQTKNNGSLKPVVVGSVPGLAEAWMPAIVLCAAEFADEHRFVVGNFPRDFAALVRQTAGLIGSALN
jgi:hypothetical protein